MRSSRMCTEVNSRCSSLAPSRRNSIGGPSGLYAGPSGMGGPSYASPSSHCSVSLSLAKVLHEKGIQAATPSTLVTPNYTPTATPCNSPERSRDSSPTREVASSSPSTSSSSMYSPFGLPGYLVASGAELLRRALVGPMTREGGRRRAPLPPPEAATGTGRALVGSNK
ncbi:trafficking kinesin-binding protein milt-like, partial [Diaphorina citri]|uniref:Trafficking kinesin-binding protein milt-like n=1 Tax=Diaphorina citri TaxID=121845 RepID=A0A1S3CTL9_DIACI